MIDVVLSAQAYPKACAQTGFSGVGTALMSDAAELVLAAAFGLTAHSFALSM